MNSLDNEGLKPQSVDLEQWGADVASIIPETLKLQEILISRLAGADLDLVRDLLAAGDTAGAYVAMGLTPEEIDNLNAQVESVLDEQKEKGTDMLDAYDTLCENPKLLLEFAQSAREDGVFEQLPDWLKSRIAEVEAEELAG